MGIRPPSPRRPADALSLLLALVLLPVPAVRAGAVMVESIRDQGDARRRALQRVPPGAVVRSVRCQEIGMGMGGTRYRCIVRYDDPPPAPAASDPQPDPADGLP
ncbi:MAG: hypothetical protein VKI81_03140 [Synechococcaceae cyanobacterium]|nr:hypothetical protein [Synechococcaceae cyanobacterium]